MQSITAPQKRLFTLSLLALSVIPLIHVPSACGDELDTLKSNTDRWIEIRSRLSRERNDWKADRQILQQSIETLQASKEVLQKDVRFHELKTQKLDGETTLAEKKLATLEEANRILASQVSEYEQRVRRLAERLPPPLTEQLRTAFLKIPSSNETATAPLPNRVQNLVSILSAVDEFNNKLTLSHSIKTLDNGEVIDVRVLYWGLAAGYASNASGTNAWILKPGPDEWGWLPADENAPAIKRLFQVYDKAVDPLLVEAPFQIEQEEVEL